MLKLGGFYPQKISCWIFSGISLIKGEDKYSNDEAESVERYRQQSPLHLWNGDRRSGNVPLWLSSSPVSWASSFGWSKGLCSLYSSRRPPPEVTSASSVLAWWGFLSACILYQGLCLFVCFNSSVVDLQCCVSSRCTAKWFSFIVL